VRRSSLSRQDRRNGDAGTKAPSANSRYQLETRKHQGEGKAGREDLPHFVWDSQSTIYPHRRIVGKARRVGGVVEGGIANASIALRNFPVPVRCSNLHYLGRPAEESLTFGHANRNRTEHGLHRQPRQPAGVERFMDAKYVLGGQGTSGSDHAILRHSRSRPEKHKSRLSGCDGGKRAGGGHGRCCGRPRKIDRYCEDFFKKDPVGCCGFLLSGSRQHGNSGRLIPRACERPPSRELDQSTAGAENFRRANRPFSRHPDPARILKTALRPDETEGPVYSARFISRFRFV